MKKALLACTLLAISILMFQFVLASDEVTFSGYVSCSMCAAAKGASDSHRECMEECLAKGAYVVLVTDNDHQIFRIENPNIVSGQHAHHVALSGYMTENGFHVVSVRMLY